MSSRLEPGAVYARKDVFPRQDSVRSNMINNNRVIMRQLDCKGIADSVLRECREEAASLRARGVIPKLAMIRVGEKGPDLSYEKGATRMLQDAGIETEVFAYAEDVSQEVYIRELQERNADPSIHGILPFLPLDHIDAQAAVGNVLLPEKDVDAATPANLGKVLSGDPTAMVPCTAAAILEILDRHAAEIAEIRKQNDPWYDPDTQDVWTGLKVCIVNYSDRIGRPLAALLTERYALVSILRRRLSAEERGGIASQADILIAASPKRNSISEEMVKPGAMVIDASTIREKLFDENGEPIINKATGKQKTGVFGCCTKEAAAKAALITPVPGVGSITSAMLAVNLIRACKLQTHT